MNTSLSIVFFLILLSLLSLSLLFHHVESTELIDQNENCEFWATQGECEANPDYMLQFCAASCSKGKSTPSIGSFYDIIEKDIRGREVNFDSFRGKVVYVVNVASQCGYTASNYELLRRLRPYISQGLEIVIAPCNQFGKQEPGDGNTIVSFANKQGYEGIILSKGDVNGPSQRPIFEYLKAATGKQYISWNFDGKFLIDREGNAYRIDSEQDVEPKIIELLQASEL